LDCRRPIEVLSLLRNVGIDPYVIDGGKSINLIAREMLGTTRRRQRLVYCDATEQLHLEADVVAANSLGLTTLWIGSGGLAHALAVAHSEKVVSSPPVRAGLVLLFVGSDHPVISHQLDALRARSDTEWWHVGSARPQRPTNASVLVIPIRCGSTEVKDIAAMAQQIDPQDVSCIFVSGGDTAALVCRALAIHSLDLQVEFAPGLPQGLVVGGPFQGLPIILKSGGFGDQSTINHLVNRFARWKGVLC